jgi:hypothetical protein
VKAVLRTVTLLFLAGIFLSRPSFTLQAQTDIGAVSAAIGRMPTISSATLPKMEAGGNAYPPQPFFTYNQMKAQTKYSEIMLQKPILNSPGANNEDGSLNDEGLALSYVIPTDNLYLEILPITNGFARLILHGTSNEVYELMSKISLSDGSWQPEQVLHRTTNQSGIFTVVPVLDRTNTLFFWARDWTGVDENSNGIPDWWEWENFGDLVLDASKDYDGDGVSITDEYLNHAEPNKIRFSLSVENNDVNASSLPVQINVSKGHPCSLAVLVDSTNFADAVWQSFDPSLNVNLGTTEGWHQVRVGLRGHATTSRQTWQWRRFKVDLTPPLLVIVSSTNAVTSQPIIQMEGDCPESLASLTYDVRNATGLKTNQLTFADRHYDTNAMEFTSNHFQCVDVELTNGVNTITLHATDEAGNNTTKAFSYTLDYSSDTNPPAINLHWPKAGMHIGGNQFTWRGWMDDPTVTIKVSLVETNGATSIFNGLVEREGSFWVENLPLHNGTNSLTLTATDAAGHSMMTNINLVKDDLELTINSLSPSNTTVSGAIKESGYTVWVNGIKATQKTEGAWQADNVPMIRPHSDTTIIVQARAIPNTDIASNIPHDINPFSVNAVDTEAEVEMPSGTHVKTCFYKEHADYQSPSLQQDASWLIASDDEFFWREGYGGKRRYVEWRGNSNATNILLTEYQWPKSYWPQPLPTGICIKWSSQTGQWQTNSWPQPPEFKLEHCDIDYVTWDGNKHVRRIADTEITLSTGGKAIAGRKSLFVLSSGATGISDEDMPTPTTAPIPPQKIRLGTMGKLGSDGKLYIVLPDGLP